MPTGVEVRCCKWKDHSIVFDNGEFSVIWGRYDDGQQKTLGIRWNGAGAGIGYPRNHYGKPGWFVVPRELIKAILHELSHLRISDKNGIENALDELNRDNYK